MFDPIRKKELKAQPEEIVRQDLLNKMLFNLGYPKSFLCVEKDLATLPHLQLIKHKLPIRRVDVLCFAKDIHSHFDLYPLLVIECKAVKLTKEAVNQVVGYNHYINSYFIAVANAKEIKTLWYNKTVDKYESVDFLPSYDQLIKSIKIL